MHLGIRSHVLLCLGVWPKCAGVPGYMPKGLHVPEHHQTRGGNLCILFLARCKSKARCLISRCTRARQTTPLRQTRILKVRPRLLGQHSGHLLRYCIMCDWVYDRRKCELQWSHETTHYCAQCIKECLAPPSMPSSTNHLVRTSSSPSMP